jgi:trimeric autotransporter adhesin
MIPHTFAAATFSRWLRLALAGLLTAAGVLLISQPQPARAATGDFEIQAQVGSDGAAYLVRGGLQTCDSTNNCTGGLTQPKTVATSAGFGNTILQVDTLIPDSGFRGTVSFQLSGLPAGVTSQTPASTTITNSTILGNDGVGDTIFGTDTTLQLSADNTAPLGNFPLTVTAASGSVSHSVTFSVDVVDSLPATTLAQLEAFPDGSTFGGTPATATVRVTFPAPASGTVVTLASSDPAAAAAPASVTIPAGATSANFTLTTQPVTSQVLVSLTATLNGQTMTSLNQLAVEAPPLVKSLTLSPTSAQPIIDYVNGDIVLNEYIPANSSGVVVALSSSKPAAAAVPATVTVTRYSGSFGNDAFFRVTLATNAPAGPVTISAGLNGQTTTAQLTILDQIGPGTSGNWGKHDHLLTVAAATNNPSDTLQVFMSGTTQLIGTLTNLGQGNYQGQFSLPANPGRVDVKSSGGATLTIAIPTVNQ